MNESPDLNGTERSDMEGKMLQLIIVLALVLSGFAGCLEEESGNDDDDNVPSSIPAPLWEVGKFWVYAFATPDETDIAARMVVAPDDGTNHLIGAASAEEARRHAILNYNPLLGRVELGNFSVYENGEPQSLFLFPLSVGNTWTFNFLEVEGWQASVESIRKASIPAMGDTILVNIRATAPGGETMEYSFDVTAGWVHLMRAWTASGDTIVNMTLVSHGSGHSGTVYFMRGYNHFDETYSAPAVDVYDTFLDSGHPDHGAFDTLVIYLNYRIGSGSSGSMTLKDNEAAEAYTKTWTAEETDNQLDSVVDHSGEYSVTVNLEGSCDLRVRIAGGIMYSWDV